MLSASMLSGSDSIFTNSRNAIRPWPLSLRAESVLAILAVAIQVGILLGMIVLDGLPLLLGQRIKLPVVPVDPRDFFRGDYVVLSYDFSRLEPGKIEGLPAAAPYDYYDPVWRGREIFISLKPVGDHYEAGVRSLKPPAAGPYLSGRINRSWGNNVDCGIEAYFVQEGEGKRLENLIREKKIMAEVAVLNGKAKLVRLIE
jgi:uncharacterized membrane-anchored protein